MAIQEMQITSVGAGLRVYRARARATRSSSAEELDECVRDFVPVRGGDVVRAALDRDELGVRNEVLHARRVPVWDDFVVSALHKCDVSDEMSTLR